MKKFLGLVGIMAITISASYAAVMPTASSPGGRTNARAVGALSRQATTGASPSSSSGRNSRLSISSFLGNRGKLVAGAPAGSGGNDGGGGGGNGNNNVDLSDYATIEYVDDADGALSDRIDAISDSVETITTILESKVDKESVYTRDEIDGKLVEIIANGEVDLSNYYTKSQVDSSISSITENITTITNNLTQSDSAISEIQQDITNIEQDVTNIQTTLSGAVMKTGENIMTGTYDLTGGTINVKTPALPTVD